MRRLWFIFFFSAKENRCTFFFLISLVMKGTVTVPVAFHLGGVGVVFWSTHSRLTRRGHDSISADACAWQGAVYTHHDNNAQPTSSFSGIPATSRPWSFFPCALGSTLEEKRASLPFALLLLLFLHNPIPILQTYCKYCDHELLIGDIIQPPPFTI